MLKKILILLVVCGCFLAWNSNNASAIGYELFFETVNLDSGFQGEFGDNSLLSFGVDNYGGTGAVSAIFAGTGNVTLYDDATRGDIFANDDNFKFMRPYSSISSGVASFYVDSSFPSGFDIFTGNALTPATLSEPAVNQLVWNSVTGASSYHVAVWNTGHSFLDGGGYVDFSERVADFDLGASTTSITDLGLSGVPTGTEYTYGIFAIGDGSAGLDGWSAAKGTLTVTPEPVSALLFLFGGISLIFSINRRKKLVLA